MGGQASGYFLKDIWGCGEEVSRIADVGDVWLDAGIVPFSTLGYFEDKFIVDTYFQIKAFEFSFYIMLKFTISLKKILKFSFEVYLFDEVFACLLKYEYHFEIGYKYSNITESSTCKSKGNLEMNFFKKYPMASHGGKCKRY